MTPGRVSMKSHLSDLTESDPERHNSSGLPISRHRAEAYLVWENNARHCRFREAIRLFQSPAGFGSVAGETH